MELRFAPSSVLLLAGVLALSSCTRTQDESSAPLIAPTELAAIDTPPPTYPADAECNSDGGTTVLRVTVEQDGVPARVVQVQGSGSASLDKAALDAVQTWTFRAATRNGKPVSHTINVPVTFPPVLEKPTRCFGQGAG